jgi:hypothetical protein
MAAGGSALWGHSGRRLWRGSSQRGSPHPALFEEARVGQGAHRRRHVLKERRRQQYSTSMGKSEVTTSSVGIEGRGARGE